MRFKTLVSLLLPLLFFTPTGTANTAASNGDSVGSLPAPANATPTKKGDHKVRAGETHTNSDGVTVTADDDSGDYAIINPKHGSELSSTDVNMRSGFHGSVEGIDSGDKVIVRSNVVGTISGTGGQVTMSNNANVTVTNTAAAGGNNIVVTTQGGGTVSIPPGSSATFGG